MLPTSAPQWSIPGVGVLHPSYDRVVIVSSRSVGELYVHLPIATLRRASHSFDVLTYNGPDPRLRSRIVLVGSQILNPLQILAAHEAALGSYRITQAEIAFDAPTASIDEARKRLVALVAQLNKRRHQRGFLRSVHKPDKTPPAGKVSEPTIYLEDRKSGVNLKCYLRLRKLASGGFGKLCLRLEWTLTGKPTLTRHLGGNQLKHLLGADLNAFLKRNLRLERVDHVALGYLFCRTKIPSSRGRNTPVAVGKAVTLKQQWNDPDYRAERAAFLVLRWLAYREDERGRFADWEQALWICRESPIQIRGYLRELRDGKRSRRGRPKNKSRIPRRAITDYKINACFRPIQLLPAPSTV
jgi:hypothetical protein